MALSNPVSIGYAEQLDSATDMVITLDREVEPNELCLVGLNIGRLTSNPGSPTASGALPALVAEENTNYDTAGGSRARGMVFRGLHSTPSGTTITIALGGITYLTAQARVLAITGAHHVGNDDGAGAVIQSVSGATAGTQAQSVQLATLGDGVNNMALAFSMSNSDTTPTWTADTGQGFTELAGTDTDIGVSSNGTRGTMMVQYKTGLADADPVIDSTASVTMQAAFMIGLEIKALVGASTDTDIRQLPRGARRGLRRGLTSSMNMRRRPSGLFVPSRKLIIPVGIALRGV